MLRIIADALFIADDETNNNPSQELLYETIAVVFQDLMFVAGTFMWLSLMCFWYQVTMPPKAHMKVFQVSAIVAAAPPPSAAVTVWEEAVARHFPSCQ